MKSAQWRSCIVDTTCCSDSKPVGRKVSCSAGRRHRFCTTSRRQHVCSDRACVVTLLAACRQPHQPGLLHGGRQRRRHWRHTRPGYVCTRWRHDDWWTRGHRWPASYVTCCLMSPRRCHHCLLDILYLPLHISAHSSGYIYHRYWIFVAYSRRM